MYFPKRDNSYKMCKINVEIFCCGRSFQAENVDYTSENGSEIECFWY